MSKFETIEKSFNQDFCNELEYHLSRTLWNSADNEFEFFWCDGVQMPDENQLMIDHIITAKQIITKAWIGENGQGIYDMIIKFGEVALKVCYQGNSLSTCLPDDQSTEWISIDPSNNIIELQLN